MELMKDLYVREPKFPLKLIRSSQLDNLLMFFFCSNLSDSPFKINLTASCNFGCECDMNDVQPVCGSNGLTYFSPCHAGCSQGSQGGNYSNCACKFKTIWLQEVQ